MPRARFPTANDIVVALFGNTKPRSLWADDRAMWVLDINPSQDGGANIYAYDQETKLPIWPLHIDLISENDRPMGMWSNGDTVWVGDNADRKLYAYNHGEASRNVDHESLDSHLRQPNNDITLDPDNARVNALWSDGTTIWAADLQDDVLYAYNLADGSRDAAKDRTLDPENDVPAGIWSDGTTTWVTDRRNDKLYAYESGVRVPQRDLDVSSKANQAWGTWSDGTTIWVANVKPEPRVLAFPLPRAVNEAPTGALTITGVAKVGQPLTVDTSGLNDGNGIPDNAFQYQWYMGEFVLFQANEASYTPLEEHRGEILTVEVSYTDGHGFNETVTATTQTVAGELELTALDGNHNHPTAIWSDGSTAWIPDLVLNMVFAYRMDTGQADGDKAFTLDAPLASATGIWSDGTTIWVTRADNKLEAHTLNTGARDEDKDITLTTENDDGYDIWSDGTTMWVVDATDNKIYAYNAADGQRNEARDITLHEDQESPWGLWSDGFTIWVTDYDTAKVFAYWLIDGTRSPDSDFALAGDNQNPAGMWSNHATVAVTDAADRKTYQYELPFWVNSPAEGTPAITGTPTVHEEMTADTSGITDRNTIPDGALRYKWYTVDNSIETLIDGANGPTYTPGREDKGKGIMVEVTFTDGNNYIEGPLTSPVSEPVAGNLDFTYMQSAGNTDARGAWSDGNTVWIADGADYKLYAYNTADATHNPGKDMDLHARNDRPWGIWSDGTTVWVADHGREKLFAYTLASGERQEGSEITLANKGSQPATEQNHHARGIWSDGTTMWVADENDGKLYAYLLSDGSRQASLDITTSIRLGSQNPMGLWSDGTTMWAVDLYGLPDREVTGYWMLDGTLDRNVRVSLPNPHQDPRGAWSDGETMWVVDSRHNQARAYNLPERSNRAATGNPEITGRPRANETLTAVATEIKDANRIPDGALRYQWTAVDDGNETDINGATGATYTARAEDAGKTLKIKVSFTDADGNPEGPHNSNPTAVIADAGTMVTLEQTGNTDPWGITSDRTTVWVTDAASDTVHSYTLADENHAPSGKFTLDHYNTSPRGMWSNHDTIWIADSEDSKLYAYGTDGTIKPANDIPPNDTSQIPGDISLEALLKKKPTGIWSNGTRMWVADSRDGKLYAYHISDGSRSPSEDMDLTADNGNPMGIWSDGSTLWVVDADDAKAYAYRMTGGTRRDTSDITLHSRNTDPAGAWGDGLKLHVADRTTGRIYRYDLPTVANIQATGRPVITGVMKVGTEVHADTSGISDGNGIPSDAFQYQWHLVLGTLDSATEIPGATHRAYTPADDQAGKFLQVRVSFRDADGFEENLTSAVSNIIVDANIPSAPNIVENALVVVWETPGEERGTTGYRILRKERNSGQDYAVLVEDTGNTNTHYRDTTAEYEVEYAYVVLAINENGIGPRSNELYAVRVRANRPATGMLLIDGRPEVGQTLHLNSRNISDEDGIDQATDKTYRWFADNARIAGEHSGSYRIRESDLDKTIRVEIHLTDNRGFREMFTSAETAAVFEVVVWKATLTVGSAPDTGERTFLGFSNVITDIGSLTENTFTIDSQEKTVRSLFHHDTQNKLSIVIVGLIDTNLTLYIGNHKFRFADASFVQEQSEHTRGYDFNRGDLTLVAGTQMVVKIK